MVPRQLVGIVPVVATPVHLDQHDVEATHLVEEAMPDFLRDSMALSDGHVAVHGEPRPMIAKNRAN